MTFNKIIWPSIGADDGNEQNKSDTRRGDLTVMLSRSEASHGPGRETLRCAQA
jgi:hypothetical protein